MTSQSNSRGVIAIITLFFTVLTALYLLIGGAWLLAVGGSAYYVITGIVLLGVAWLLWRRSPAALVLYALVLGHSHRAPVCSSSSACGCCCS
jgi:quinoprotein glucose dehydrogenase